jgi:hypothetical protein
MLTEEDSDEKGLATCRQNVDWGDTPFHFHCCSLPAQASLSANHPNNVRHRRAGSPRDHLRDAVKAVVAMKVRLRVARRYTCTVHLRRDAEQDGT